MLENEQKEILNDLENIAIRNGQTGNFETTSDTRETEADELDLDNRNEEFEENSAIVEELNIRLQEIESALLKIESNNYGNCEVCEKEIEEDRLMANPSAKTCKEHLNN